MTTAAHERPRSGVVLDVDDLPLPGDVEGTGQLVLSPRDRGELDAFMHAHAPETEGELDVWALRLACCADDPRLSVPQARRILDDWPAGDVDAVLGHLARLCPVDAVWAAWWRLELDETLRLEMGYCAPLGIPRSRFLGGPDLWTQADRELAIAWELRRLATCPGCGTRPDQWERDRDAFIPDVHGPDKGCEVKQLTESQLTDEDRQAGVHVVLEPRAVVEARDAQSDEDGSP